MKIEEKTIIRNYLVDALALLKKGRYTLTKETIEKVIKKLEE